MESRDVPATPGLSTPPKAVGTPSVTAGATASETLTEGKGITVREREDEPIDFESGVLGGVPARSASAGERLIITVAIVLASVLSGAAVPILLSLL